MSKTCNILLNAAEIVSGGWTQGAYARDVNDNQVSSGRPEAVCFCILGAIERACINEDGSDYDIQLFYDARDAVSAYLETSFVSGFNDNPFTTKEKVVSALQTAAYWKKGSCWS